MTLMSGGIEGKQLNLCRGNIMFCHVDSFRLQEKNEDEKRSIFLFQYWGDRLSNHTFKSLFHWKLSL